MKFEQKYIIKFQSPINGGDINIQSDSKMLRDHFSSKNQQYIMLNYNFKIK